MTTDGAPTTPLRARTWPWWLQVLAVHAAARAVSVVVFVAVARTQEANPWTGASPSYLEFTGLMWDAGWYRQIAEQGYPTELPRGSDGVVVQNAWAFFPLYPALVRLLLAVTGASWHQVAPVLSLVLGAAAVVVLHRLVERALTGRVERPRAVAMTSVVLLTAAASAPVLQLAYTESLALLLVAGSLLLLHERRYLVALPVVLALGLTRPVALPVVAAVALHAVARWREDRIGAGDGVGERWRLAVLGVGAVASGLLWPGLVALATGETDAYTETQAAWRGTGAVVPVRPWVDVATWLMGPVGVWVLVGLLAGLVAALLAPGVRRLGPEMHGWVAGYVLYLVAVLEPGTSLVRFALLAFPFWVAVAAALVRRGARAGVALLVLLGVVGQVAWVGLLWRLVPPSGWPP